MFVFALDNVSFWPTEIQRQLEFEKEERQKLESKLLEKEKSNNELLVDLSQFQQQITTCKAELQNEVEKVSATAKYTVGLLDSELASKRHSSVVDTMSSDQKLYFFIT